MGTLYLGDTAYAPVISVKEKAEFGLSPNFVLGTCNEQGDLVEAYQEPIDLIFTGVKSIKKQFVSNLFQDDTTIKSVSFPDLLTLDSSAKMEGMFYRSKVLTSVNFPKLTEINRTNMYNFVNGCNTVTSINFPKLQRIINGANLGNAFSGTSITSIAFPELVEIKDNSFNAFSSCTKLTNISFPKLRKICGFRIFFRGFQNLPITTIEFPILETFGEQGDNTRGDYFYQAFSNCKQLTDIYFRKDLSCTGGDGKLFLRAMLQGTIAGINLHFTVGSKTFVESQDGYAKKFDNANANILFDL